MNLSNATHPPQHLGRGNPIPDPDVIGSSPAPALANLYLHGPGVDEPLAWWSLWTDSSGSHRLKPVLLLADGLGSITGLTANADYPAAPKPVQGLASTYHYDSFGNQVRRVMGATPKLVWGCGLNRHPQYNNSSRLNPYRYAAREWLSLDWSASSALGLSDNRARFYDPSLASFLQEDPVFATNLFAYSSDSPVYHKDPHGNEAKSVTLNLNIRMLEGKQWGWGLAWDNDGNFTDIVTTSKTGDASAGASIKLQYTVLPDKDAKTTNLLGTSLETGASIGGCTTMGCVGGSGGLVFSGPPTDSADVDPEKSVTEEVKNAQFKEGIFMGVEYGLYASTVVSPEISITETKEGPVVKFLKDFIKAANQIGSLPSGSLGF